MASQNVVGIKLVAALHDEGEGGDGVFGREPVPHGVPLFEGPVHVAGLLAVAGHIGDARIDRSRRHDAKAFPVERIGGRGVYRQVEGKAPDARIEEVLQMLRLERAMAIQCEARGRLGARPRDDRIDAVDTPRTAA